MVKEKPNFTPHDSSTSAFIKPGLRQWPTSGAEVLIQHGETCREMSHENWKHGNLRKDAKAARIEGERTFESRNPKFETIQILRNQKVLQVVLGFCSWNVVCFDFDIWILFR